MMNELEQIQSMLNSLLFGGSWALAALLALIGAVLALSRFTRLGRI